jgi:hypothetical protein
VWQRATGYGRRNLVETAISRYKHLIDPKLRARMLPTQQGEAAIAVAALNQMIRIAEPRSPDPTSPKAPLHHIRVRATAPR